MDAQAGTARCGTAAAAGGADSSAEHTGGQVGEMLLLLTLTLNLTLLLNRTLNPNPTQVGEKWQKLLALTLTPGPNLAPTLNPNLNP